MADIDNLYKLCYVEGNFAYFTIRPLKDQWGDDWNDAPYPSNAGEPYCEDASQIIKIVFDGPFQTPDYLERFSVEQINAGAGPWLSSGDGRAHFPAGMGSVDFCQRIVDNGGAIYFKTDTFRPTRAAEPNSSKGGAYTSGPSTLGSWAKEKS